MAKLLLVEDNQELAQTIRRWLEQDHHIVDVALDGDTGEEYMANFDFDLIILDWKLPGKSGIELCQKYRDSGKGSPILMLTGKGDLKDKLAGFESGADDYLTKPFETAELLARIKALLKRPRQFVGTVLAVGGITLDVVKRTVTCSNKEIILQRQEFALLEYMMRHADQVISTDALLSGGWESDNEVSIDALYTCIGRLRRKLKAVGCEALTTVPAQGYRMKSKA
jgi:OmpR-family two-component system manganese-sensing response regulator